jgi:hypothetical protein
MLHKKSGLKLNKTKTEVYVVQKRLAHKVHEIKTELGLKGTTQKIVRYLGNKFRQIVEENTEKLKGNSET